MVEVLGSSDEDADSMEQSITDQVRSKGLANSPHASSNSVAQQHRSHMQS